VGKKVWRVASNAVLVVVAVLFGCVLSEVGLRLAGIGYGHSPIEASRRLHHEHPKNYRFVVWSPSNEFGGHSVSYDSERYRVDEDATPSSRAATPHGRRIAFLGDSFTEANSVAWRDSFIGQLQRANPDLTVRNYGVSSFAPLQYLIQMRQDVPAFHPTDVVLQLYWNDFGDDYIYLRLANSRDLDAITGIDGGDQSLAITILRYSYLARLIRRSELTLLHLIEFGNTVQPDHFPDTSLPAQTKEWTQHGVTGTQDLTWALLETIRRETEKQGARFHLFIIPDKIAAQRNACCADDKLSAIVADFAHSEGISYIDLAKAFGEQSDQARLFWQHDIHLSAPGNLVAARAIADKLGLARP
jgi:hypothetical protein